MLGAFIDLLVKNTEIFNISLEFLNVNKMSMLEMLFIIILHGILEKVILQKYHEKDIVLLEYLFEI